MRVAVAVASRFAKKKKKKNSTGDRESKQEITLKLIGLSFQF
jgi:hypothetical protein